MAEKMLGLDSFDTTVAAEEGAVMEVRSPKTGEVLYWPDGRPWTITYFGADSERVVSVARQQADRRAANVMRTRDPVLSGVLEKDDIELLVVATKSWDIPLGDGSPAANESKEFRAAYLKYRWLFEQGSQFSGKRANFLKT